MGTARTFQLLCCSMYCLFLSFYVLFVCKCVLYFWVTTQLQLTNIKISNYHSNMKCDKWYTYIDDNGTNVMMMMIIIIIIITNCRFQNIKRILVSRCKSFAPGSLSWLPPAVTCLDFDGELFQRGRLGTVLDFQSTAGMRSWLPEAEAILKGVPSDILA